MQKKSDLTAQPGWSLDERNPDLIERFMPVWEWLYRHYFRVQTSGWHHIPSTDPVLFVGSHNGGFAVPDMFMMMYDWFRRFGTERSIYGLMHPLVWSGLPWLAQLGEQVGAIQAHPKMAIAALNQGSSVLVYPGGVRDAFRLHELRHKIFLDGNQAFIKLALVHRVPIVPLISHGAHDTLMIVADWYEALQQLHERGMPWLLGLDPEVFPIYLGLPWGVGIGPLPNLPLPVTITTRVCAPVLFKRYGEDAARDREYVNACYNQVCAHMQQELNELVYAIENPSGQTQR